MQALTPLLFAMLFPRFSKNDTSPDAEGNDPVESLLGGHRNSTSSEVVSPSFFSFGEGYPVDEYSTSNQDYRAAAKVRRHHSTGSNALLDSAQTNNTSASSPRNTSIRRNNTVPQVRRTSRSQPQRLSIDHAAFIATYPSLDGLGDMGYRSSSSLDYYRNNNTANTANNNSSTTPRTPRSKASSSKLRKQQSQETLPSRASTSSIASMVSDASSSTSVASSSASSAREPLTPTKASNYHSILSSSNDGTDASSSTTKKSKRASLPVAIVNSQKKDLISLDSVAQDESNTTTFQAKSPMVCQSPQSDNFFSAEESFAGPVASVNSEGFVKARGQRQLIAH
ncbi:hypothetical protein BGW39_001352 [Mortierella sp. 14UC]|nr:hypothetical protein BGW39_001352 [Mortierella sp. 14UC]